MAREYATMSPFDMDNKNVICASISPDGVML
jgi:hypothetical protein